MQGGDINDHTRSGHIVTGYPKNEEIELKATDKMLNSSELFHLWVIEAPQSILFEIPFKSSVVVCILLHSPAKFSCIIAIADLEVILLPFLFQEKYSPL